MREALQDPHELRLQGAVPFDRAVEEVAEDDRREAALPGEGGAVVELRENGTRPVRVLATARSPRAHMGVADDQESAAGERRQACAVEDHAASRPAWEWPERSALASTAEP